MVSKNKPVAFIVARQIRCCPLDKWWWEGCEEGTGTGREQF